MRRRAKKRGLPRLSGLTAPLVLILGLLVFSLALFRLSGGQSAQDKRQLEDALRRAAVACYAVDGVYPPTLEDLRQRCGLQIDEDRYAVYYDVFAENLMSEITVLEKET